MSVRIAFHHVNSVPSAFLYFASDGESAPLSASTYEDVHVVAGVLKLFLRLLPIPLITFDSYTKFFDAVKSNKVEEKLEAMKEAVKSLPPAHYQSLKYLMSHLQRVSEHQKKNLMSPKNLSTVFSPTVMRTPDIMGMGLDQMSAWHTESAVVELLISYNRTVFVQ